MLMDQLGGAQLMPGFFSATITKNSAMFGTPISYISGNPSYASIKVFGSNEAFGAHVGTYDGAVVLRKVEDARWAGYWFGDTTQYIFAHYQPN